MKRALLRTLVLAAAAAAGVRAFGADGFLLRNHLILGRFPTQSGPQLLLCNKELAGGQTYADTFGKGQRMTLWNNARRAECYALAFRVVARLPSAAPSTLSLAGASASIRSLAGRADGAVGVLRALKALDAKDVKGAALADQVGDELARLVRRSKLTPTGTPTLRSGNLDTLVGVLQDAGRPGKLADLAVGAAVLHALAGDLARANLDRLGAVLARRKAAGQPVDPAMLAGLKAARGALTRDRTYWGALVTALSERRHELVRAGAAAVMHDIHQHLERAVARHLAKRYGLHAAKAGPTAAAAAARWHWPLAATSRTTDARLRRHKPAQIGFTAATAAYLLHLEMTAKRTTRSPALLAMQAEAERLYCRQMGELAGSPLAGLGDLFARGRPRAEVSREFARLAATASDRVVRHVAAGPVGLPVEPPKVAVARSGVLDPLEPELVIEPKHAADIELDLTEDNTVLEPTDPIPLNITKKMAVIGTAPDAGGFRGELANRTSAGKRRAARRFGMPAGTDAAILAGLRWLHQAQDKQTGGWNCRKFGGNRHSDRGVTGLALLAFLGFGCTAEQPAEFAPTVRTAVEYLIKSQHADGVKKGWFGERMYSQGICTAALAEFYAMTGHKGSRRAAQAGLDYILKHQPAHGAFGYTGQGNDVSVTGFQMQAMKAARVAHLAVPKSAGDRTERFLAICMAKDYSTPYRIDPSRALQGAGKTSMTAVSLAGRLFMGHRRTAPDCVGQAGWLTRDGRHLQVAKAAGNLYSTYYLSLAMFHMGGTYWKGWNAAFNRPLRARQVQAGPNKGSWPVRGMSHGQHGGRVYTTAMACLGLEVYFRYRPSYQQAAEPGPAPAETILDKLQPAD